MSNSPEIPDSSAMSDIVERLRYTAQIRAQHRSEHDPIRIESLEAADTIDALRAENEKLRAALRWMADKYDEAMPMRTADFHIAECTCMRCARDNARAELEKETSA